MTATQQLMLSQKNVLVEAVQLFDGLAVGTLLNTQPGWAINPGNFYASGTGGMSSYLGNLNVAAYTPVPFVTAPNHEAEVVINPVAGANDAYSQGAAVAVQPDGSCYFISAATSFVLGLSVGGAIANYAVVAPPGGLGAGAKLRISVTGVGTNRRTTGSYDIGGGWVTPAAWVDKDWGPGTYFDGGKGGIVGQQGSISIVIDKFTVRCMAPG